LGRVDALEKDQMTEVIRSVTYRLTEDEYVAAGKFSAFHVLMKKKYFLLIFALSLGLFIFGYFMDPNRDVSFRILAPLLVASLLLFLSVKWLMLPRRLRKIYKLHKVIQQEIAYDWSQPGLNARYADGAHLMRWAEIFDIAENGRFFLFYPVPGMMQIIAKKYLSAEQIEDLRLCASSGRVRQDSKT
jgi:hypothetical protein